MYGDSVEEDEAERRGNTHWRDRKRGDVEKTQFFSIVNCVLSRQNDESERTMAMQLLYSHRILKWLARHESDKESKREKIQSV